MTNGSTILRNSARCLLCNEEIESKHRHDFVWCKGQHIFVDGGKSYLRRGGDYSPQVYLDTSIFKEKSPNDTKEPL